MAAVVSQTLLSRAATLPRRCRRAVLVVPIRARATLVSSRRGAVLSSRVSLPPCESSRRRRRRSRCRRRRGRRRRSVAGKTARKAQRGDGTRAAAEHLREPAHACTRAVRRARQQLARQFLTLPQNGSLLAVSLALRLRAVNHLPSSPFLTAPSLPSLAPPVWLSPRHLIRELSATRSLDLSRSSGSAFWLARSLLHHPPPLFSRVRHRSFPRARHDATRRDAARSAKLSNARVRPARHDSSCVVTRGTFEAPCRITAITFAPRRWTSLGSTWAST